MSRVRRQSLGLKIGLTIVAVEIVALALLGQYYMRRFSLEADQRLLQALEKPGELMEHGILNLGTISDRSAMLRLIGPALVDAHIVGANGNVFHAMNPDDLGKPFTDGNGLGADWMQRARNGPFVVESRDRGETFLTRVSPIGVGEGRAPFLFAVIQVRTTEAVAEKAALRRRFILGSVAAVVATSLALLACLRLLVTRRLDRVAAAVQRVADGDYSARVGGGGNKDEVGQILDGIDRMAARLQVSTQAQNDSFAALQSSEQRFRAIVTNVPVVIFSLDKDGIFTLSEGRGLQNLGLYPGQVVGQSVYTLYRDNPDVITSIRRALAGEEFHSENVVQEHTFETWYAPLRDERGEVTGVLGVASDVTDRRRAEDERVRLERQVLHTQKLESLGVLAGGIAHDFNNILTAILGHAELARMLETSPAVHDHIDEIQRAARRAADLARQMLAYSGKGRFALEQIELNKAVQEMVALLSASMPKTLTIRTEFEPSLPTVVGDETQVRQVIMNLLTNAAEAVGERDGSVVVRTGRIESQDISAGSGNPVTSSGVTWKPEPGSHVFVEVRDNGCGMDAATLERIFDPFFTTKFTGRGLGLAVVLGIVRGHRGALLVRSEPGAGSCFTACFPVSNIAVAGQAAPTGFNDDDTAGWKGYGTVLLVDDEEPVRVLGGHMLHLLGFDVVTAEDGVQATELFASRPGLFRCVILDCNMPRRDGADTCRELRRIRPGIPVVLSSGYTEQEVHAAFGPGECPALLKKPFTLREMTESIRAALEG